MNKRIVCICISLMVSFSTGIFVEIAASDYTSASASLPSFWAGLWENAVNDIITVLSSIFFALTVYLLPCTFLLILHKTFTLGFSSAYMLSQPDFGLQLLGSVLLPRAMLKIPAYIFLLMLSIRVAKETKSAHGKKHACKALFLTISKETALCLLFLLLSSIIEVGLMQLMS